MNTHYVLLEYVSRVYANKHLAHGHTNNATIQYMLIRFRRKNASVAQYCTGLCNMLLNTVKHVLQTLEK